MDKYLKMQPIDASARFKSLRTSKVTIVTDRELRNVEGGMFQFNSNKAADLIECFFNPKTDGKC